MDEKELAKLRVRAASAAACALKERSADTELIKVANDRLAEALADYRRLIRQKHYSAHSESAEYGEGVVASTVVDGDHPPAQGEGRP